MTEDKVQPKGVGEESLLPQGNAFLTARPGWPPGSAAPFLSCLYVRRFPSSPTGQMNLVQAIVCMFVALTLVLSC
jgi:hypothetical protein